MLLIHCDMIANDEGIKLASTYVEVIVTTLLDFYLITLVIDVVIKLVSLDGSFGGFIGGNIKF